MPQPRPNKQPSAAQAPFDFEQAVEQVEQIIARIESGEIGLDRSIAEYERGVALIRRCRDALAGAEQRIQELTRDMNAAPDSPATPPEPRS